jgi:FkbM family methyltransferase
MRFSQNLEQDVITEYFKNHIGTFIDIGANDGITLSNTRRLAELGWSGVCVEPSPKAYAKLSELYPKKNGKVYTYPFALGHTNDDVDFWESGNHLSPNDVGLLSTQSEEEMKRFPGTKYEPIKVKSFRWKTFLNRLSIKEFDFVSIDTEGNELIILEQMDLTNVKMICVEWNSKNKEKYDHYMNGFKLVYTSGENLIYAR